MYPIGWTTNKMSILWVFFMYNKTKSIGVDEMSIKLFTKEEIGMLKTNKYVKHVSAKGITYTDEFRRLFISEYEKGRFPRVITVET